MKLADANPGDILQDRDGDTWVRGQDMARCLFEAKDDNGDFRAAPTHPIAISVAEKFGPFTRLIPEEAAEW